MDGPTSDLLNGIPILEHANVHFTNITSNIDEQLCVRETCEK